jgi:death on curing protein
MNWITEEYIIILHKKILLKNGGTPGLRDVSALKAAIAAPLQTFDDTELFPTEIEKIARLAYGLTCNHPFIDGNKRIGALVLQILLRENGYRLHPGHYELSDIFLSIARDEANNDDLAQWIRKHLI